MSGRAPGRPSDVGQRGLGRATPGLALALATLVLAACATTRVSHHTVRFVNENEAVSRLPVVTVLATPTPSDDLLRVRLARRLQAPLYEVDVTEEQARRLDVRKVFVIALLAISGGGITFGTSEGTTVVRGQPRKVKDLEEVESPWPGGSARIEVAGGPVKEATAGPDGEVRFRLRELLGELPGQPGGALRLTVSASLGPERDAKTVEVGLDTLRAWWPKRTR